MPRHSRSPRHRHLGIGLALAAAAGLSVATLLAPGGTTKAAFSDFGDINGNNASASVWQPDPTGLSHCGDDLSAYKSISYVDQPGTTVTAEKYTILVVDATNTLVYTGPNSCVVATVSGVDITDLHGNVHLVLTVLTDACETANKVPPPGAPTCADWAKHHPTLVALTNGSDTPAANGIKHAVVPANKNAPNVTVQDLTPRTGSQPKTQREQPSPSASESTTDAPAPAPSTTDSGSSASGSEETPTPTPTSAAGSGTATPPPEGSP